MGMSTHVVGFRPPDEKWNKMKSAWETCESAGVPIPEEVLSFFDHEEPGDKPGAEIDLDGAVSSWSGQYSSEGYEIDINKLPKDVTVIRVYNSF